jgi:hypothetical protein
MNFEQERNERRNMPIPFFPFEEAVVPVLLAGRKRDEIRVGHY